MSKYYDKKHSKLREYKIRDLVWLEATNITTDQPSKKLDEKRWGPFKVISKISASSYKLDLPREWKRVHNIFNEVLLMPYIEPNSLINPKIPIHHLLLLKELKMSTK